MPVDWGSVLLGFWVVGVLGRWESGVLGLWLAGNQGSCFPSFLVTWCLLEQEASRTNRLLTPEFA